MTTILHAIETSEIGGAESMMISLAEHMDRGRYEPVVCLLADGRVNAELQRRGIETVILPQKPGLDGGWLVKLVKFVRRRNVKLMHAQEFAMNTCCSIASAVTGIPVVTTIQGKSYYPDRWRRRLAYRCVSKHSRMIAVSDDLKQFLVDKVGVDPRRVSTIHNGIDPGRHHSDDGGGAGIRKELGLGDRQPVVGTVGNLYPVKGHIHLLKAMASVVRTIPDAVCFIAGRGELDTELRQAAVELGIDRNLRLLGFRPDVPALLRAADVFVLPSLSEGLSLALLEAWWPTGATASSCRLRTRTRSPTGLFDCWATRIWQRGSAPPGGGAWMRISPLRRWFEDTTSCTETASATERIRLSAALPQPILQEGAT